MDTFIPMCNILKTAGSRLGMELSGETKAKLSEALKGKNNGMFGKPGDNHPNFGLIVSTETRTKLSSALSGSNNP